ncbi:isoprenylcysteine carboxylmethyltransferase family protein [Candidatus Woesearchaeota archaeon]|nr:isoprenylcysteine carboxylmethyltransferase family protein [Candidatus Woesearchaeota archaeon]
MNKPLKIKPPYIAFSLLFLSWLADYLLQQFRFIYSPYNKAGIVIIILGLSLTFSAFYFFKKNKTPIIPGQKPTFVVAEGPYKFTRNPMYLGVTIALLGAAIFFGNALSFLSPLIFFLIMNYYFVPFEENLMKNLFGKKYLNYKKRVGRWI